LSGTCTLFVLLQSSCSASSVRCASLLHCQGFEVCLPSQTLCQDTTSIFTRPISATDCGILTFRAQSRRSCAQIYAQEIVVCLTCCRLLQPLRSSTPEPDPEALVKTNKQSLCHPLPYPLQKQQAARRPGTWVSECIREAPPWTYAPLQHSCSWAKLARLPAKCWLSSPNKHCTRSRDQTRCGFLPQFPPPI
jgi:hypothetical protein